MDPALWEIYEEGSVDDEVSVILRLADQSKAPADVRVIASFGKPNAKIVTARCLRRDIQRIHDSDEVVSMKASSRVVSGKLYGENDDLAGSEVWMEEPQESSGTGSAFVPENGAGVIVGICDWGFDFTHPNFRNPDGTTRFLALWDQLRRRRHADALRLRSRPHPGGDQSCLG